VWIASGKRGLGKWTVRVERGGNGKFDFLKWSGKLVSEHGKKGCRNFELVQGGAKGCGHLPRVEGCTQGVEKLEWTHRKSFPQGLKKGGKKSKSGGSTSHSWGSAMLRFVGKGGQIKGNDDWGGIQGPIAVVRGGKKKRKGQKRQT